MVVLFYSYFETESYSSFFSLFGFFSGPHHNVTLTTHVVSPTSLFSVFRLFLFFFLFLCVWHSYCRVNVACVAPCRPGRHQSLPLLLLLRLPRTLFALACFACHISHSAVATLWSANQPNEQNKQTINQTNKQTTHQPILNPSTTYIQRSRQMVSGNSIRNSNNIIFVFIFIFILLFFSLVGVAGSTMLLLAATTTSRHVFYFYFSALSIHSSFTLLCRFNACSFSRSRLALSLTHLAILF